MRAPQPVGKGSSGSEGWKPNTPLMALEGLYASQGNAGGSSFCMCGGAAAAGLTLGLQATADSLRSCVAPASGSGSGPALSRQEKLGLSGRVKDPVG